MQQLTPHQLQILLSVSTGSCSNDLSQDVFVLERLGYVTVLDSQQPSRGLTTEGRAVVDAAVASTAGQMVMRDDLTKFLYGAVGIIKATGFEQHKLWSEYHRQRLLTWEEQPGMSITVGLIGTKPVSCSVNPVIIKGKKILFVNDISTLVDHDLIDAWLLRHVPPTALKDPHTLNKVNAMNAHIIIGQF